MSLKEIAEEKLDNVKGNIERVPRLFQDGGAGETYGKCTYTLTRGPVYFPIWEIDLSRPKNPSNNRV